MRIRTIKQLLDFSNKRENECSPRIEIDESCSNQIKRLNEKAWSGARMTANERKNLHIIDNLFDRFREENTALVCNGVVLN